MLLYGCAIYEEVVIGRDCRIAGFIPSGVTIGNNVTMMGTVAHKYDRPLNWFRDEPSPQFEDDCVVGLSATIVGGITIGRNSYVAAHALVTKDVPPNSFAYKFNEIMPLEEFERLKRHPQGNP
jgi:acetyltransferase-like isoleucine patch superfamily enzyme